MPVFRTPFSGNSVKFSPFYETRIAVATSQNFGFAGNGRLHVLDISGNLNSPTISEVVAYDTAYGVNDVSWSESHDSLLVAAIADGSVKLYDLALPPSSNPIRSLHEHAYEVHSTNYNLVRRDSFVTSSWDHTVKLWTLDRPTSLRTFKEHANRVYSAVWDPRHPDVFASASGDCTVRIWDVREPRSTMIIPGHYLEIRSCDWNKYNDRFIATASVDRSIKVWDVRYCRVPYMVLNGHRHGVMKVKLSPYIPSLLMSCSYDMTVCIWDYNKVNNELQGRYDHHTEFTTGVDMSELDADLRASTGWDGLVYVWRDGDDPRGTDPRGTDPRGTDPRGTYPRGSSRTIKMSEVLTNLSFFFMVKDALEYDHHTEFATGVYMSELDKDLLVCTDRDELVYVWRYGNDPRGKYF